MKRETIHALRFDRKILFLDFLTSLLGTVFAFILFCFLAADQGISYWPNVLWIGLALPIQFLLIAYVLVKWSQHHMQKIRSIGQAMDHIAENEMGIWNRNQLSETSSDPYGKIEHLIREIDHQQNVRQEMLHGFSHELKTPLSSIQGFSKLLMDQRKTLSDQEMDRFLGIIFEQADKLSNLVDNLGLAVRMDIQKIINDKRVFDLGQLIRECLVAFEPACEMKKIDLTAEIEEIDFVGNPSMLQSAIGNLISNAVKFSDQNGKINVVAQNRPEGVWIEVIDNGIGMSEETKTHVFERKFQASPGKYPGQGLGLSIVKQIVQLYGGTITIESQLGKGSSIRLEFPNLNETGIDVENVREK